MCGRCIISFKLYEILSAAFLHESHTTTHSTSVNLSAFFFLFISWHYLAIGTRNFWTNDLCVAVVRVAILLPLALRNWTTEKKHNLFFWRWTTKHAAFLLFLSMRTCGIANGNDRFLCKWATAGSRNKWKENRCACRGMALRFGFFLTSWIGNH